MLANSDPTAITANNNVLFLLTFITFHLQLSLFLFLYKLFQTSHEFSFYSSRCQITNKNNHTNLVLIDLEVICWLFKAMYYKLALRSNSILILFGVALSTTFDYRPKFCDKWYAFINHKSRTVTDVHAIVMTNKNILSNSILNCFY